MPGDPQIGRFAHPDDLFRQAIEAAPVGMLVVDGSGRIVLVNAELERLFGYRRAELLAASVEDLVPEANRAAHAGHRGTYVKDPHARAMGAGRDLSGRRKDGSVFPVEIGLNPVRTANGVVVIGSVIDISERKSAAERLEALVREKDVLLRELHHRVKNNLQLISSLLNLQARGAGDAAPLLQQCRDRVQAIAAAHEQLRRSKDLGRIDLGPWLDSIARPVLSAWDGGDVSCSIQAEGSLPVDAAVPCGLIVNELVTNAIKHAFPDRTGTLAISARSSSNGEVSLTVRDDGVGRRQSKEGLGLELVRTLARQLRGELQLDGPPGTTARLTFRVNP